MHNNDFDSEVSFIRPNNKSQNSILFSFVNKMYLNIASYFYGKQIKSKLGNKLYFWVVFVCEWKYKGTDALSLWHQQ